MIYVWVLVLAAALYGLYLFIKWSLDFTPPEGYHYKILEKGGRFEQVALVGPTGRVVAKEYTSVYGLNGAARQALRSARATWKIEGQTPEQYAKVEGRREPWRQ